MGGALPDAGGFALAVDPVSGMPITWNVQLDREVDALLASNGSVLLGGQFTNVNGTPHQRLARVDLASGALMPWDAGSASQVICFAATSSALYLGSLGGSAAVDLSTGELSSTWQPGVNGPVYALATAGGVVYAGVVFTFVGGTARNHAVALGAADASVTAWNPSLDSAALGMAISGSTIYLVGDFTKVGNMNRAHAAAVDTSGSLLNWNPNTDLYVNALAISGNTVYLVGAFTTVGGTRRNYAAAVDAANGTLRPWNPNLNNQVNSVLVVGHTIYLGGAFTGIADGGPTRLYAAAFDDDGGALLPWAPAVPANPYGFDTNCH
jgi:hypothetical protein